jgi:cyanobactin cluster PatC/TenC/TruC protein
LIKLGVDQDMASKKEEKSSPTSSKTESSKTEPKKTSPPEKTAPVVKVSTGATGLEDYGFWCEQVKKERAAKTEPDPPFRRGRIWA